MSRIGGFFWILTWITSFSSSHSKSDEGNAIVFPESVPSPKQEIPLALVRRLNEEDINSIYDFMDTFIEREPNNTNFPFRPGNVDFPVRIGLEDTERSALQSAKMAKCMPELTTVPLLSENDSTVFYYPSCTRVHRCGGCCAHRLLSCQPEESEILHFSVIAAEYRGGSQMKFKGKETVQVEQHTKCKCDCKVQPEHCTRYQTYSKDKCSCECSNKDDERKCSQERKTKIWNTEICSCICKQEMECSTGSYFDPFNCRCEVAQVRRRVQRVKAKTPRNFPAFYNITNPEHFIKFT